VKRIAILGAGISGLSAGFFLNNAGIEFKIFEKQGSYGGLATSYLRHGHKTIQILDQGQNNSKNHFE